MGSGNWVRANKRAQVFRNYLRKYNSKICVEKATLLIAIHRFYLLILSNNNSNKGILVWGYQNMMRIMKWDRNLSSQVNTATILLEHGMHG